MRRAFNLGLIAIVFGSGLVSVGLGEDETAEKPFLSLFNGNDLKGWKALHGKDGIWRVDDEMLTATNGAICWLMTEQTFKDFELRLEYRVSARGNSGIALRSPLEGDPTFTGMELQIQDDATAMGLSPEKKNGSIYDIVAPEKQAAKAAGQWNKMRILARGPRITVELNEVVVLNVNMEDHKARLKTSDDKLKRAHPGLLRESGHIGLQAHTGTIAFRNIRIRSLDK